RRGGDPDERAHEHQNHSRLHGSLLGSAPPILDHARRRIVPLPVPVYCAYPTWNRPPKLRSRKRRSTLVTVLPARRWSRSAAGTCPSNTPAAASSPTTPPSA